MARGDGTGPVAPRAGHAHRDLPARRRPLCPARSARRRPARRDRPRSPPTSPLAASRAMRGRSVCRFVATRASAVACWWMGESTVLPSASVGRTSQDGGRDPGALSCLTRPMAGKVRTVEPGHSRGVAKDARIAPNGRHDGGARPRWRREPGSFPSLPWPRGAGGARGERPRAQRATARAAPAGARHATRRPGPQPQLGPGAEAAPGSTRSQASPRTSSSASEKCCRNSERTPARWVARATASFSAPAGVSTA
jgi:hypothetical protein